MTKQEEREFDELDYFRTTKNGLVIVDENKLKQFISNLTKKREIKLIEEVERLIDEMLSNTDKEYPTGLAREQNTLTIYFKGVTLNKLKEKLQNLKKLKGK